ncbi:dysbindin-like [Lingula anatina]|uniref:Dysbindin-like n=1 Tax=Lingula anatina TaxID=7574 RepID=A0A1S3KED0_LINAN|nr:dysbindin-like [Lingula anatina]|eukprot:XP_013420814.1 dysbindin-like [Lingula anatina]
MSVFKSIKGTLQSVQNDISAGFKSLREGAQSGVATELKKLSLQDNVNYDAGADILNMYQQHWSSIHLASEENAKKAQQCDETITSLYQLCQRQSDLMSQLNLELSHLPKLVQDIELISRKIASLSSQFEDVEKLLVSLEQVCEQQELERSKLNHRYQLALYKEKKKADLEQMKVKLAGEHVVRVRDYELSCQLRMKERQEAYEQAFEEEMEYYKTYGQMQRQPSSDSGQPVDLAEVSIEEDPNALNDFLDSTELDPAQPATELDEATEARETEDCYIYDDDEVTPDKQSEVTKTESVPRSDTVTSSCSVPDRETQEGFIDDELEDHTLQQDQPS